MIMILKTMILNDINSIERKIDFALISISFIESKRRTISIFPLSTAICKAVLFKLRLNFINK